MTVGSLHALCGRMIQSALGVALVALGVALMTKVALGCTPIAALPYFLSVSFPVITFGQWVIVFNLALVVAEVAVLKGKIRFSPVMLQCILACLFGSCVDIFMYFLGDMPPSAYTGRLLSVLGACVTIGAGASLGILANLAVLPGDGFTIAVAAATRKDIGRVRILSDTGMSLCALALCWLEFHEPLAVREGTLLAALLTGIFVRLFMKAFGAGRKRTAQ